MFGTKLRIRYSRPSTGYENPVEQRKSRTEKQMSTSVSSFGYTAPVYAVRASAPRAGRLRMTRRGRAVLLAMITTPLVIAALAFGLNAGGATATDSSTPLKSITVSSGESLWQVALKVAPNTDPRDVIADIMSLNNLTSADLQPGQKLDIPAQYEH